MLYYSIQTLHTGIIEYYGFNESTTTELLVNLQNNNNNNNSIYFKRVFKKLLDIKCSEKMYNISQNISRSIILLYFYQLKIIFYDALIFNYNYCHSCRTDPSNDFCGCKPIKFSEFNCILLTPSKTLLFDYEFSSICSRVRALD